MVDRFAAVIICSMLAETLFQLRGHYSFRLILLFGLACMVTLRGIYFQRGLSILLVTGGAFAISAYFTGRGYRFVQNDLFSIFQGAVISGFIGLSSIGPRRREQFWLFLHRGFSLLGAVAGYFGLFKLVLFNRGVTLLFFYTDEGYYPPGSSLNGDYNTFSLGMVVAMGSAVWLLQRDRNYFFYLLSHLALPGMVLAVMLTSSRRAFVFLALGVVLALGTRLWRRRSSGRMLARGIDRRGRWIIGLAYAGLIFIGFANHETVWERVSGFLNEQEVQAVTDRARTLGTEESVAGRTLYWQATYRMLQSYTVAEQLTGNGFGYIGEMGSIGGVEEDYPHNFLLSSMLYGGAIQTLLTLAMLAMVLRRIWQAGPDFRVVAFWVLVFLLFHLTSSNSIFSTELFVVIMVLALDAVPARIESQRERHPLPNPQARGFSIRRNGFGQHA